MSRLFRLPLGKKTVEADVDTELQFHLEMRIDELIRSGLPRAEAEARAQVEFGDLKRAQQELAAIGHRREAGIARAEWWRGVLQDARIALRSYARDPLFTLVVVLTLGLGIGANTTIFGLVDAALLRPLPYAEPHRLVHLWETHRGDVSNLSEASYPDFQDWRAERGIFAGAEGYDETNVSVSLPPDAPPERLQGARVSPGFFDLLGIRPLRGRFFTPDDDGNGGGRVVLLSYGFWTRRLGADPDIVGRQLVIDGTGHEVRGVLPANFSFAPAGDVELWLPLGRSAEVRAQRFNHWVRVVGRLRDGVTLEQARQRMAAVMTGLAAQYPESNSGRGVLMTPLPEVVAAGMERPLLVLFGAVGLVLLIACANVATLLLARAVTRSRELALRSAIGAARSRLIRQLLTEHLVLSLAGAMLGVGIAALGVRGLLAILPDSVFSQLPTLRNAAVNLNALGFTTAVALGLGLLIGLAPALLLSRRSPAELLRSDSRTGTGKGHHRLRDALVMLELALTLVLLVGAGLLGRSLVALLRVDPGFTADQVVTVRVALAGPQYADGIRQNRFFEDVLARARALPGVVAVGAISNAPLQGGGTNTFHVDGEPEPPTASRPEATTRAVAGEYFSALRIPLLAGRVLEPQDDRTAPYAVVLSRDLSRRLFGDQPAVGRRIRFYGWQDSAWAIVGVVGDVKTDRLDAPAAPTVYYSHLQGPANRMSVVARSESADPTPLIPALRREVHKLDPAIAVYFTQTMGQYIESSEAVTSRRYILLLLGAFAAAALLLALIGVYGVIAYSVAQRTREVAIRVALGANRGHIVSLISRNGIRLLLTGLGFGSVAAFGLTRAMRSLLFGVGAADLWTYGVVALLLGAVVMIASAIPAWRATKVDPAITLRTE